MGNVYLFLSFWLTCYMCISGGHPCLWTLCGNSALSFGEGVGGKSSARREFTASWGVYIFWCPFIDFHIGANFFLDRNPLNSDIKKREIVLLSIPHIEALALPIIVEQTTSEPTPIWIYKLHAETDVHINIAPNRIQYEYTQYSTDRYNHTRDIYRWLCSWL